MRETDRGVRGDAAVVGFNTYGIHYTEQTPKETWRATTDWLFGYADPTEVINFGDAHELVSVYHDAIATDAVEVSTRLWWNDPMQPSTDAPPEVARNVEPLEECSTVDQRRLSEMADTSTPLAVL
jgi:hypothetical protein